MAGLWDYDEEVEAYEPEPASSASDNSDGDEEASPAGARKKARKRKAASQPAAPPAASTPDDDLLQPITITSDDSDDDDVVLTSPGAKKQEVTQESSAQKRGRQASGSTQGKTASNGELEAEDRPEQYLDKDTLQQLNQQDDLRKLLEEDDLDLSQPETSEPAAAIVQPLQNRPRREVLTEEDRRALASIRQPPAGEASTSALASGGGDATGADEDSGGKIYIWVQSKDGKVKIKINPQNPFQKLIEAFTQHARQKGWLPKNQEVRLMLDGDVLSATATPADLDLENDDVVEARY